MLKIFFFIFLAFLSANVRPVFAAVSAEAIPQEKIYFPAIFLTVKDQVLEIPEEEIKSWVEIDTRLSRSQNISEIENPRWCNLNSILCILSNPYQSAYFITKKTAFTIKKDLISDYTEELKKQTAKEPADAKFSFSENDLVIFSPAEKGYELENKIVTGDIQKSLSEALKKNRSEKIEITAELKELKPKIDNQDANGLGISEVIAEGKSNFKGSPKSRIHNIKVGAEKFNGVLIKPGEEFSFVEILGPVDGEHGYLPELVIKNNRTEPEFGGGICQVSTTMFRAAINAGFKITERKNHAYAVSYYNPPGMDSTVYIPRPDLKFVNNSPGHVLIQLKIVGTEISFLFYGKNDGRKVEISAPVITLKNTDGSMATRFTQKMTNSGGSVIIDDIFKSFYNSPDKYPHPGEKLTKKPDDWSKKEWSKYKKDNNIP